MRTKTKLIIGIVAVVVLVGAWVAVKSFTGNEMGQPCNGDGDCKGMEAVCLISADNEKYCTVPCNEGDGCPAGYACETVNAINITGTGEMTAAGSERLCSRAAPAEPSGSP